MIFSCFTLKLKEKVGGLLGGEGGPKGILPPSQIIGGGGGAGLPSPLPLFLRLCTHQRVFSQSCFSGATVPEYKTIIETLPRCTLCLCLCTVLPV